MTLSELDNILCERGLNLFNLNGKWFAVITGGGRKQGSAMADNVETAVQSALADYELRQREVA